MADKILREKLWRKDYILIMISTACISTGNYFLMSTLPIYAEKLTDSTALAGIVTGVYTFSALISRPVSGMLADSIGRIKVAIIGAVLALIALVLYNAASAFAILIIFRIIHGFGFGIHSTAALTAATDIIPVSRRMEGIGYLGLFTTLIAAVGPAFALTMVLNRDDGFNVLFFTGAGFAALAVIANLFINYEKQHDVYDDVSKNPHSKAAIKSSTILGFEKSSLYISFILFIFAFSASSISSYIALYAKEKDFGNVGLFFTLSACSMALTRLFSGRIGDKYGAKMLLIPALIIASLSFLLISISESRLLLILLGLPFGLAQGTIIPTMNVLIITKAPPELRGAANGTYYAAMDTGIGLGSMFWGALAEVFGFSSIYYLSTILPLIALVLYIHIADIDNTKVLKKYKYN